MAQIEVSPSVEANEARAVRICDQAADSDMVIFPEVQVTPFFAQYPAGNTPYDVDNYKMSMGHPFIGRLQEAAKNNSQYISPNLYIEEAGRCYDRSLWIRPDGTIGGKADMVHIFQAPRFYEQDYYTPSRDGFKVFDTEFGRVGIVICFDRHIPESIQTCARRGAQLVIIPTANCKAEPMDLFEWEVRVQAMHNQVYIAMCNRVGTEGDMEFAGESLVAGPEGDLIVKADDARQVVTCDIDLSEALRSRERKQWSAVRREQFYE